MANAQELLEESTAPKIKIKNTGFGRFAAGFKKQIQSSARSYDKNIGKVNRFGANTKTFFQVPSMKQVEMPAKRFARALYPQIPAQAVATPGQMKAMQKRGVSHSGRGRPTGSYKYFVGGRPVSVFTYRKVMARQRAYQRLLAAQKMAETGAMPTYQSPYQSQASYTASLQPQQYQPSQIPINSYTPQLQAQQQASMQAQMAFQPQAPVQREIKTVFKSFGGSPYPPVNPQPLMASDPYSAYVEDVDLMTGRRFLKMRPKAEKWIQ